MSTVPFHASVTPAVYDSIYLRKLQHNFLNTLDDQTIGDASIAGLQCTGFLAKNDLSRYKKLLTDNLAVAKQTDQPVLLDLGCGLGKFGCWLARELNFRSIGIDFSRVAIKHARTLAQHTAHKSKARFKVGDFAATGLPTSSVCAIVSLDALYMTSNPVAALREIQRVLIPGGILFFTLYVPSSTSATIHRRCDWTALLRKKGFLIVHHKNVTTAWRKHMKLKHKRRWAQRDRIKAALGGLGEAELSVSAAMLGFEGRPSYLSSMSRFEIVAKLD